MAETVVKSSMPELSPGLRASVRDGMYQAAMIGSGESYLSACAIFFHATTLQVGLLSSLPAAVSGVLQVISLKLVRRFASRRAVLITAATIQSYAWILLSLIALFATPSPTAVWLIIAGVLLYYVAAGIHAPTWNSLIGDTVPADRRGRFFGFRSQRCGICTFVTLTVAGQTLDTTTHWGMTAIGFGVIFLGAAWFRYRSVSWLRRYDDPTFHHDPEQQFSLIQFLRRLPRSNFGRFALFIACINFAVSFSAPYFSLYLLRDLKLSYFQFTVVTATATLTQFTIMQYWGKLTDIFGSKQIMTTCGIGIAINPILWLFSKDLSYLVCIQIFSGIFWAGFSLAASTFLFDAVTPQKRARCAAYQALLSGSLQLAGSTCGAFTASHIPMLLGFIGFAQPLTSPLLVIFFISGILRGGIVMLFLPRVREVREVSLSLRRELLFRILHLRPIGGILFGTSGEFHQPEETEPEDRDRE